MNDADDCRALGQLEAQARARAEEDLPHAEGREQIKRALDGVGATTGPAGLP